MSARPRAIEAVKSLDCQFATDQLTDVEARFAKALSSPADDLGRQAARATLKGWEARGVNAYLVAHRIVPHGLTPVEEAIVKTMIDGERFSVQDIVEQLRGGEFSVALLTRTTKEIIAALIEARVAERNKRGVFNL